MSRRATTVAWTRETAITTGHRARAGEGPRSVFLSAFLSHHWPQAVGQRTFPGTAKEPAASLESALELSLEQLLPPHPGFTVATEPRLPRGRDPEDPGPREM